MGLTGDRRRPTSLYREAELDSERLALDPTTKLLKPLIDLLGACSPFSNPSFGDQVTDNHCENKILMENTPRQAVLRAFDSPGHCLSAG
jgi:hypothetical protein